MNEDLMTFGEFLSKIIKRKNISVSKLTELTGTKSRNAIQRILKDESSINVIEAFRDRLIEVDAIELSESELKQLDQALEVSRVGKDTFGARKILLQMFDNSYYRTNLDSPIGLNPVEQTSISLRELFDTYKSLAKINILIFDVVSAEFINELVNLIWTSPQDLICISQILYLGESRSHNAAAFVSIFKLINYEHYEAYSVVHDPTSDMHFNISSDTIVVEKLTVKGKRYTDLIKLDSDRSFSCIKDEPGNSLYNFYLYHFNKMKTNCPNIRRTYERQTPINTILNICNVTPPLRENTDRYLIKNSFAFSTVPLDILDTMMIDADYFGMDQNNQHIQKLIKLIHERFDAYYNVDTLKVNFLTKRGLLDFVKNGIMTDHFCHLRPFKSEEVKAILEFIIKQLQEKDFLKIFLLINDSSIGNIQFSYFENKALWIYDAYAGFDEDYFEGFLESVPILEVYDDFIKNELLKNHTYPESETIEFLKYLISIA